MRRCGAPPCVHMRAVEQSGEMDVRGGVAPCVHMCAVEQSGEMDVRAGVAALRAAMHVWTRRRRRCPRSWVFFQRSSPWRGSAPVVVCTRVLSAELDRGVLKSA